MWWAMEEDYDYGYVMASRDGVKWEILPGQQTRTDNPSGNNWGAGYTGHSTDLPGAVSGWVTETFDLSAFAGGPVWVQFNYVTDDAVNAAGWFVDQITVTEDGTAKAPVDEDETAGWQSEGWLYTDNWLPQPWLLQVMEFDGDRLTAVRRIPIDGRPGRVHRRRARQRSPCGDGHQWLGPRHDVASHVRLYAFTRCQS